MVLGELSERHGGRRVEPQSLFDHPAAVLESTQVLEVHVALLTQHRVHLVLQPAAPDASVKRGLLLGLGLFLVRRTRKLVCSAQTQAVSVAPLPDFGAPGGLEQQEAHRICHRLVARDEERREVVQQVLVRQARLGL